ncbi:Protein of unknown function [Bacillus thuringiensis]|uniref:Uncharacterized protein n=1 Tax=Bacillus thuringiensis TaxID=1428 RepID=A0A1C4FAK7_BACTU|nr:Protein of unknown function [Bacillus thuringiensis]
MNMKKMIETIEATKVTNEELSISTLHQKLVKLYSQKDSAEYTDNDKIYFIIIRTAEPTFRIEIFWCAPGCCCR